MDTNYEFEKLNTIFKLHIEALTPYTEPPERSERPLRLEISTSCLWKEEEELRDETQVGVLEETFGPDTLFRSLALLDLRSLIRCAGVDRSMNCIIRSLEFRRMWSAKQSLVVLVSSYTLPCKLLLPGSSQPPQVFQPLTGKDFQNALVVASDRGLVCVRFKDVTSLGPEMAVGNPLTQEWVALPKSQDVGFVYNHKYRMQVTDGNRVGHRVHFKVATFSTSQESYCYHVFDSATGSWRTTKLDFPRWSAHRWAAFDIQRGSWRTELVHNYRVKTGLERSPGEVHRLPHPGLHGFEEWEYKGSTYFASVWTVLQERYHPSGDAAGEFAGYGVWKVQRGTASGLEPVAAAWARELGAINDAIVANCYGSSAQYVGDCSASANLVCFGGETEQSPTMPLVVYDIESGQWRLFDEQHPPKRAASCFAGHHYGACVPYLPSLLVSPHKF